MKPTLLFATLSMVLASPAAFAKSELETLRSLCSEQERQIHQLEDENSKLRSMSHESRKPIAKSETPAADKSVADAKPAATTPSGASYTVVAGDTFERIARKIGGNPDKLAKANGMTVNSIIHPGQKLKVAGQKAAPAAMATAAITPKAAVKIPKPQPSAAASNTNLISAPLAHSKAPAVMQKSPTPVAKVPTPKPSAPATRATAAAAEAKATPEPVDPPVTESASISPTPEKKNRPVTIDGEMTYGEFASKHGTNAERLNALNGLDLTTATVLAKGSELYVPAQP